MIKLNIITLTSGLGNQMYQYALYYYLKSNNYNVKLFLYSKFLKEHNGFQLGQVFRNIKIQNKASFAVSFLVGIDYYLNFIMSVFMRFSLSKLFFKNGYSSFLSVIIFPGWDNYIFNSEFIAELQTKLFLFPPINGTLNLQIFNKISESESVSLHIRRGDYITNPHYRRTHGDVCDKNYYREAINEISKVITNPVYFIFSDDIEWAKSNLEIENVYFIDWNKKENSYMDMVLMSYCKHNIIANSTFSIWAAILNQNKNKIVVAPYKWLNDLNDETPRKFLFPEWVKIMNTTPSVCLIIDFAVNECDIRLILNQTHNDFELVIKVGNCFVHDSRILYGDKPNKDYKLTFGINEKEIKKFSNKRYLEKKIVHYYETFNNLI